MTTRPLRNETERQRQMKAELIYERERDSLLTVLEQNGGWSKGKEYNAKVIRSGKQLEVQLYEVWDTKSRNKGKAGKISRPRQQLLNEKYRQQKYVRLVNANFDETGTWLTLTWSQSELPEDEKAAYTACRNYLQSVQRKYKNTAVKAVFTVQHTGKHCHRHICINISDRDGLEELWCSASERARKRKNPYYRIKKYGRTQARRLQGDDFGFTGMAMYICKHGKCYRFGKLAEPVEKKTKNLKSRKLTRAFVKKLAEDKRAAKLELVKLFPEYQFSDIEAKQTPYTSGWYLYRRMKYVDGS